jgi:hypothetical protein
VFSSLLKCSTDPVSFPRETARDWCYLKGLRISKRFLEAFGVSERVLEIFRDSQRHSESHKDF